MTKTEINISIAKASGFNSIEFKRFAEKGRAGDRLMGLKAGSINYRAIPNFAEDLNAMHEAEKCMMENHPGFKAGEHYPHKDCVWFEKYEDILKMDLGYSSPVIATAQQRSIAFLKTLGLYWEDVK